MDKKKRLHLFLLFLPAAYFSYLFHELGHWVIGELLGYNMTYRLNFVTVKEGEFLNENHRLLSSVGGPLFTMIQGVLFLWMIKKFRKVCFYPFLFFAFFTRFFPIVFGGFQHQDEATISSILGAGKYTVAIVVLSALLLMVWKASKILGINLKNNGVFFAISTFCMLLVIGTYTFLL
ncbi:MAG: hypothetical protein V2I54_09580 [Bacteroidales bacterium]|jgi:hypothetical protein|nr:hypothetical protein [Bacteroidales bacterium]